MAQLDTLGNVRHRWSIDDLFDAHELLDMQQEAESRAWAKAMKGTSK